MATLGDSFISRTSPGKGSSRPPLKKKVTCAYFSVSATWNWERPRLETTSLSPLDCCCGEKTTGEVKAELYLAICTHSAGLRCFSVAKSGLTWG